MRYQMLAIDLDGTLLNRRGRVTEVNIAAIVRAQQAGVLVVPCTGRGWIESKGILHAMPLSPLDQPGVFVTGACVTRLEDGRSFDLAMIEPHVALQLVRALHHLPEAVLVLRDYGLAGHDYLVTGAGTLTPNTQWWFEATGATVHFQSDITLDDMHHVLRVALVAGSQRMDEVKQLLAKQFGDQVFVQSFTAVQHTAVAETMHVLEIFARGVDKWRGLKWIAQRRGIDPEHIAAIGDEINDVAMLQHAGCGIAMGNAIDAAREVARYHARSNDEDGVAYAIDKLLAGEWV